MKLSDREWREFFLIDTNMFYLEKGKWVTTTNLNGIDGIYDVVGATSKNNGNVFFANVEYSDKKTDKNAICLIKTGQGSVGEAVYKGNEFIPSNNVYVIRKNDLNKYTGLFITTLINKQSDRYSYGYIRNEQRVLKEKIMLPVTKKDETKPDWPFMEEYIKKQYYNKLNFFNKFLNQKVSELKFQEIIPLEEKKWGEFFITELFSGIQRGKRLIKYNQIDGSTPYVSSTSFNNGVDNYISNNSNVRKSYDCLTIANSGSVGASFYHPYEFVASDHVTCLKNDKMNKYIYLFITTLTNRLSEKYNFNREINDRRILREKIILPINEKNEPDYDYMEQYIKNLIIKKYKQFSNN